MVENCERISSVYLAPFLNEHLLKLARDFCRNIDIDCFESPARLDHPFVAVAASTDTGHKEKHERCNHLVFHKPLPLQLEIVYWRIEHMKVFSRSICQRTFKYRLENNAEGLFSGKGIL